MDELASRGPAQLRMEHDGLVAKVSFTTGGDGHRIPAMAWLPTTHQGAPVVLLGHGGSGHKAIDRHHQLAQQLAGESVASLAIDGPYHGDRAVPGDAPLDYQHRVADEGPGVVHARMCQDWLYALDAASHRWGLDEDTVGYFGMSMGARYGIAVCAALGARLRAAVLGKFGLVADDPMMVAVSADEVVRRCAAQISAPVLHHVQWNDEIFPLPGQLELFDLFASPEKTMRARPGRHHETRADDLTAWHDHLAPRVVR
ncbi:hypothetical protein [Ornithinimicrobium pratense]|uniref:Alpha/beta hydrolase n=1 Tax=Ornithinimicrobium pratense TaxID=2593973 RepID=A0A5J6V6C9_9MICO|nr:hypothetical protein [Ornithinimicrobium pratense]QFG69570.1 hypothetical protein FY030_13440 [Ornithinimicrobium pratense]